MANHVTTEAGLRRLINKSKEILSKETEILSKETEILSGQNSRISSLIYLMRVARGGVRKLGQKVLTPTDSELPS
jgi:hypothetical protein